MLPCGIIASAVWIEETFRARVQSPQVWMLTVLIISEGQRNYWPVLITALVLQCHNAVSCHGYIMISVTMLELWALLSTSSHLIVWMKIQNVLSLQMQHLFCIHD